MCRRFTTDQWIIATQREIVRTETFMSIYKWTKADNVTFTDNTKNPQFLEPVITEDT